MDKRWGTLLAGIVIVAAVFLVYARAINVPFIFDDHSSIIENPTIHSFEALLSVLAGPPETPMSHRPVVNLSFAINYAIGGLDVRGYHLFNITLHALSVLLLLGIVRRTLAESPWGQARGYRPVTSLAIASVIALVWALHPLNSEAVIYSTQRTELFVIFFYLLTLYCAIRGWLGRTPAAPGITPGISPGIWFFAAVAACAAGMASKEVMVSAPLAVLLYDRAFVSRGWGEALRRSRWLYLGLALTWALQAALVLTEARKKSVGLGMGVTSGQYLLTQAGVILHYLRLCVWPTGLTIAYDWPIAPNLGPALPAFLAVTALVALTVWALWRRPAAGFSAAVFFLVLAPSSSLIPIVTEVAVERRTYLPCACVVVLLVVGGIECIRRLAPSWRPSPAVITAFLAGVLVLAGVEAAATIRRLHDYRSEVAIWDDATRKRPDCRTAWSNLGVALMPSGDWQGVIDADQRALLIDSNDFSAHNALGAAFLAAGRVDQAITEFNVAIKLSPTLADAWYNLGNALIRKRQFQPAIEAYRNAIQNDPGNADGWLNLGNAYLSSEPPRLDEAIAAFHKATGLAPGLLGAWMGLGNAQAMQGQLDAAAEAFSAASALAPQLKGAQINLGRIRLMQGRFADAAAIFQHVTIELAPSDAQAWDLRGQALASLGQISLAAQCFEHATRLAPAFVEAKQHLERARAMLAHAATRPAK